MHRIRSWARTKAHGSSPFSAGSRRSSTLPISTATTLGGSTDTTNVPPFPSTDVNGIARQPSKPTASNAADTISSDSPPPAPPPEVDGQGNLVEQEAPKNENGNVAFRFYHTTKNIILSSWINVLLVFVPVGIIVKAANLNPTIIFAMNAIAIIPLAGLLSHATESVAKRMGDTIGALMNVTFGNAVELIIFIIALSKDEIRIVQASLLGSILANLLLILGMCFLIGGLRFREQIYNSTVTQMSACLLSLSVMSLLLPTAFHASFSDSSQDKADTAVLQVSRGTSIILLVVYFLYLLFQLKSHAYMYESTPQHIIDEELAPGPVAAWMDSSSSDDDSSSSSDSDDSRDSNNTASRIKRVMRGGRRRRKSSAGSQHAELPKPARSPSYQTTTGSVSPLESPLDGPSGLPSHRFGALEMTKLNGEKQRSPSRSFNEKDVVSKKDRKEKHKKQSRHERKKAAKAAAREEKLAASISTKKPPIIDPNEPRRVDFAVQDLEAQTGPKKPFTLGGINLRPAIPKTFSQNVFSPVPRTGSPHIPEPHVTGPIPRVRYGIRRTNSLPDRLNLSYQPARAPSAGIVPAGSAQDVTAVDDDDDDEKNISRTTAVVLLLASTGLVALCAEFMVDSIQAVTATTSLGETFVGLIILPIVGNAAEHVTSVSVASKNKMDLAIGVAVGSSIQIALFVTPFIVLLGWIMDKSMTLYFTLFETVSLFVSTFIINFLILDGRSNYLEGALLCAAYMIIAVAAFFYPGNLEQSVLGGNPDGGR